MRQITICAVAIVVVTLHSALAAAAEEACGKSCEFSTDCNKTNPTTHCTECSFQHKICITPSGQCPNVECTTNIDCYDWSGGGMDPCRCFNSNGKKACSFDAQHN